MWLASFERLTVEIIATDAVGLPRNVTGAISGNSIHKSHARKTWKRGVSTGCFQCFLPYDFYTNGEDTSHQH